MRRVDGFCAVNMQLSWSGNVIWKWRQWQHSSKPGSTAMWTIAYGDPTTAAEVDGNELQAVAYDTHESRDRARLALSVLLQFLCALHTLVCTSSY